MPRRLGSIVLALAVAAVSACAAFIGLLWSSLTCDDSCGTPPPWRNDPGSWQWDALGWIGVAGFACSVLFVICLAFRRRFPASIALASWGLLAFAFLTLFGESGLMSKAERGWLGLAAVGIAGVAAIALGPSRSHGPLAP